MSNILAIFCAFLSKVSRLASLNFIGLEILVLSNEPINFFLVTAQIMGGQFVVVSIIGIPLFKAIKKNKYFYNMLKTIPHD